MAEREREKVLVGPRLRSRFLSELIGAASSAEAYPAASSLALAASRGSSYCERLFILTLFRMESTTTLTPKSMISPETAESTAEEEEEDRGIFRRTFSRKKKGGVFFCGKKGKVIYAVWKWRMCEWVINIRERRETQLGWGDTYVLNIRGNMWCTW